MFRKLKERLPRDKSESELDEHFEGIEKAGLEKSDIFAMLIAAFFSLVLPLLLMLTAIYGSIYLLFLR